MATALPIIELNPDDIEFSAIRAQGAGGQNVNKVSTAIHLRFDIPASSLPLHIKERLLQLSDQRISKDGVLVIKAQSYRTQEQNRDDAVARLQELVDSVAVVQKARRPTKPTYSARRKRLDSKSRRGEIKAGRKKISD
jgi:ribosome-associated protein